MASVARLKRTKKRLTLALIRKDIDRLERGLPVKKERWLRARLHRIDGLLEREGAL